MNMLLFFSGLAVLLFAMKQMEQAIASLGQDRLQALLERSTRTPLQGVVLGTLAATVLQSSTLVGLMTMAFVGAGLLPLRNAIGVILGSNLGTTLSSFLVALVGFKVNLDAFHDIILGLGAVMAVFGREEGRLQAGGRFVVSLGLLLFALLLMKDSISFIVDHVDVGVLRDVARPVWFLFGILLTAVIQSSTATMMIMLSALDSGIVDIGAAGAVIIGSNLGTTGTMLLVGLKGLTVKRQIALVHVLFNAVISVLAILLLPQLLWFIDQVLQVHDPIFELALLHCLINFSGVLLFLPLVGSFRSLVERLLPLPARQGLLVGQVSTEVPAVAFKALEGDVRNLLTASVLLNAWRLGILPARESARRVLLAETAQSAYAELKAHENQLSDYVLELQRLPMSPEEVQRTQQLLVCIRDCLYSTKAVKDVEADLIRFRLESGVEVKDTIERLLGSVEKLYAQALELLEAECCITPDDFRRMREVVKASHAASNVAIYQLIDRQGFRHDRASSALNINRELLFAAHSLINALENFLVPGAEARSLSEWLSSRI